MGTNSTLLPWSVCLPLSLGKFQYEGIGNDQEDSDSSRDRAHELEVDEDFPMETCAFSRQREPEDDYNVIMSSEIVDDDPDVSIAVDQEDSWQDGPVRGMESVVVSVSGYEGLDRQNLVKLINKTGAAFTGQLSKANTHLGQRGQRAVCAVSDRTVCRAAQGR